MTLRYALKSLQPLPICSVPIPKNALSAMSRANRYGDYDVRLFEGHVAGRQVACVVAGESHYKKTMRDVRLGESLVASFATQGFEGSSGDRWGDKLFSFVYWPFRSAKNFRAKSDSTIGVQLESIVSNFLRDPNSLQWAIDRYELRGKSDAELEKIVVEYNMRTAHSQYKYTGTGLEVMNAWNAPEEPRRHIHLEAGHVPSLAENFSSLVLPLGLLGGFVNFVTAAYAPDVNQVIRPIFINGAALTVASSALARLRPYGTLWRERLDVLGAFVYYGRDRTMTHNIVETLRTDQNHDIMLAIVGKGHVKGIGHLLTVDRGFQEVEFPSVMS